MKYILLSKTKDYVGYQENLIDQAARQKSLEEEKIVVILYAEEPKHVTVREYVQGEIATSTTFPL